MSPLWLWCRSALRSAIKTLNLVSKGNWKIKILQMFPSKMTLLNSLLIRTQELKNSLSIYWSVLSTQLWFFFLLAVVIKYLLEMVEDTSRNLKQLSHKTVVIFSDFSIKILKFFIILLPTLNFQQIEVFHWKITATIKLCCQIYLEVSTVQQFFSSC